MCVSVAAGRLYTKYRAGGGKGVWQRIRPWIGLHTLGADHRLGLGSSLLRLTLPAKETLSFFLFFFILSGAENTFYSQPHVPHVVRSIDSRPGNKCSPLIQGKLHQRRRPIVEHKSLSECH